MIRRLLGFKSRLEKFNRLEEPVRFAEEFGRTEVHVLQLPIPGGFDPTGLTDEEFADKLLAQLDEAAGAVANGVSLELFSFARGSSRAVPLFSTEKAAQRFAQSYVTEANRVLPLAVGEGPVAAVVAQLGAGTTLVVDPGTSGEWDLSADRMKALLERWA